MGYLLAIIKDKDYNPIMPTPRASARETKVSNLETHSANERRTREAVVGNR